VVQIYASRQRSAVERPCRWLVGFQPVELEPGASATARVDLAARALAHWGAGRWEFEPGDYRIEVGRHAGAMVHGTTLTLEP
jgi:beta-glucosidase